MPKLSDITLIGGGITGLLSARLFVLAGANVTLIDKGFIGQESSWAGGGILLPLYPWRQAEAISELVAHSVDKYPNLTEQLFVATGIDPEYSINGLLMSDLKDHTMAQAWCKKYQFSIATATETHIQRYPQVTEQTMYLPEIAQVRNPRLLKSLKQDLLQRGVTIVEQCKIESADIKNQKITHIRSQKQRFPVNQVVINSGAWTADLWQQFVGESPKIFPVKGEMLILGTEPNSLQEMILDNNRYLIPRKDGKVLCGSTVEQAGFNKTLSESAAESLADFARKLCPTLLKNAPILHHWAGLRPGTEQGIPYVDKHPTIENLAINAGHFRNGFAMGPAAAQLLYDLVTGTQPVINPLPYQLSATH